jgi:hypothetical protein
MVSAALEKVVEDSKQYESWNRFLLLASDMDTYSNDENSEKFATNWSYISKSFEAIGCIQTVMSQYAQKPVIFQKMPGAKTGSAINIDGVISFVKEFFK